MHLHSHKFIPSWDTLGRGKRTETSADYLGCRTQQHSPLGSWTKGFPKSWGYPTSSIFLRDFDGFSPETNQPAFGGFSPFMKTPIVGEIPRDVPIAPWLADLLLPRPPDCCRWKMQFGRHGTTPLGLDGTGSTVGWLIGLDYLLVPEFHWMSLQFLLRLSMLVKGVWIKKYVYILEREWKSSCGRTKDDLCIPHLEPGRLQFSLLHQAVCCFSKPLMALRILGNGLQLTLHQIFPGHIEIIT